MFCEYVVVPQITMLNTEETVGWFVYYPDHIKKLVISNMTYIHIITRGYSQHTFIHLPIKSMKVYSRKGISRRQRLVFGETDTHV